MNAHTNDDGPQHSFVGTRSHAIDSSVATTLQNSMYPTDGNHGRVPNTPLQTSSSIDPNLESLSPGEAYK